MIDTKRRSIVAASLMCGAAWSALSLGGAAYAQTTEAAKGPSASDKSQTLSEVIVTGTLVRGVAPTGDNVIGLSKADVQETGATTTAQLLQTIPQMGSFNSLQFPVGGFNGVTTNRPNLRNLPGFTSSGGSTTLVLVDGHRVVGMGIASTSPDPDIVPPSMIQRVEIVADGGSAIYGSDAVAGVINFITRKSFDGAELSAKYGLADHYHTFNMDATVGRSWDKGSAYFAWDYSEHGAIFGRDRDFVKTYPTNVAGIPFPVTSIRCSPGNVQVLLPGNTIAALPFTTGSAVRNTANQCDESDDASVYPREHRHSLFGGFSQELNDKVKLDVRGFYMIRDMFQSLGDFRTSSVVGPAAFGLTPSPFEAAHSVTGSPIEIQQVQYAWGGPDAENVHLKLKTWGIAPTLTADLGGGWQLRALTSYSGSTSEGHTIAPDASTLANAIRAGLFNPYDPASSDPRALQAVAFDTYGLTRQRMLNSRVVVDGDLLTLPGGAVKLAAGVEYTREKFHSQQGSIVPGTQGTGFAGLSINGAQIIAAHAPLPVATLQRDVKSVFGELVVPIIGSGNRMPGIEELTFSASGRYDDYSDFGDTFNPKFGLTYRPVEWVKLRGAWGKSFVAPSLADNPATSSTGFNWVQGLSFLLPPPNLVANGTYPAPKAGQFVAVVTGSAPGIQPQKAKNWSIGFDVEPPVVPGLNLSMTYWNIKFDGVISIPPFFTQGTFWTNFGSVITTNPSVAQINSLLAASNTVVGGACAPLPTCVYAILDVRKKNLGNFKMDGLDFAANYTHPMSFGSIDFAFNGTYELDRSQSPIAGAPFADLLAANNSRYRFSTSAGAQIGKLRAQATLNHSGGYKLDPAVGVVPQSHVGSFDVVNLFFKYDFNGKDFYDRDLSMTLNIDNVFDQDPPVYRQQSIVPATNGYINGITVGRLVTVGIDKKF